MAIPNSLILASEVIGFISFVFTLFTALGVYTDLIKTLQGAPAAIPIALGNLREEIRYEQALCKQQFADHHGGDRFHVFPTPTTARRRASRRRDKHEFARLLSSTLRHIWLRFCDIEREFLTEGTQPSTTPDSDDWDDDYDDDNHPLPPQQHQNHHNEKGTHISSGGIRPSKQQQQRKDSFIRSRLGWVEAGLSRDRRTYYNTDLGHRFRWWWKKGDVDDLAEQVQRLQIRRVERDAYETNALVKRALRTYARVSGRDLFDASTGDDSDSSDGGSSGDDYGGGVGGPRGGGGGDGGGGRGGANHDRRKKRKRRRHHHHSSVVMPPPIPRSRSNGARRQSRNDNDNNNNGDHRTAAAREAFETEPARRRAPSPTASRRESGPPLLQQQQRRTGSVVYEYEIVDPGGIHVEYRNSSPRRREERMRRDGGRRSYGRPASTRHHDDEDEEEED